MAGLLAGGSSTNTQLASLLSSSTPLGQIYYPMGVSWGVRRPATFVGVAAGMVMAGSDRTQKAGTRRRRAGMVRGYLKCAEFANNEHEAGEQN